MEFIVAFVFYGIISTAVADPEPAPTVYHAQQVAVSQENGKITLRGIDSPTSEVKIITPPAENLISNSGGLTPWCRWTTVPIQ